VAVVVTAKPHSQRPADPAPPPLVLTVPEAEVPELLEYLAWAGKYHAVVAQPLPMVALRSRRWKKSALGRWWRKVALPG